MSVEMQEAFKADQSASANGFTNYPDNMTDDDGVVISHNAQASVDAQIERFKGQVEVLVPSAQAPLDEVVAVVMECYPGLEPERVQALANDYIKGAGVTADTMTPNDVSDIIAAIKASAQ